MSSFWGIAFYTTDIILQVQPPKKHYSTEFCRSPSRDSWPAVLAFGAPFGSVRGSQGPRLRSPYQQRRAEPVIVTKRDHASHIRLEGLGLRSSYIPLHHYYRVGGPPNLYP